MKRYIILYLMCAFALLGWAQRKQISAAQDLVKAGKDLPKAEKSMRELLSDTTHQYNMKAWVVLCDAMMKQYEQGNEKLYLKQKYDTASFFSLTKRMFETMERFDTIDAKLYTSTPIKPKYRERYAQYLNAIRPNLFNGGNYFLVKKDYAKAFEYFDSFILSDKASLFEGFDYEKNDPLMPHAAYWAMYVGYKLNEPKKIMKYAELAERDTSMHHFVKQYEATAYLINKDTARYISALKEGFEEYPNFAFFFPRLVEYYAKNGRYEEALETVERALKADSTSIMFRFTKSTALLNLGRYDESIKICEDILKEKPNFAEAYYNIGISYFDQAIELAKVQQTRAKIAKIHKLYEKAMPYLERYKELMPQNKDKWLAPLYTIYLNLNMGKEFDEIDRIRNGNK